MGGGNSIPFGPQMLGAATAPLPTNDDDGKDDGKDDGDGDE
jgi:hypothetical protein